MVDQLQCYITITLKCKTNITIYQRIYVSTINKNKQINYHTIYFIGFLSSYPKNKDVISLYARYNQPNHFPCQDYLAIGHFCKPDSINTQ